jgi:serine/threonine-protein kinase
MRFIRGESMDEAIRRLHEDRTQRAFEVELRKLMNRFLDVCNALEYAHSRGVVHRDIKPSNIMLGRYGETSVVDWGLAKYVGRDEKHRDPIETALVPGESGSYAKTAMGSAVGTIQYMSPEQAAGSTDVVGPQSDIYSLGATLYALLCGQPPIAPSGSTDNLDTLKHRLNTGDYPKPRQLHSRVPAALEAICLKAMSLRPEARYATARALAADVEAWMADEPVQAWREPLRLRLGRWMRRHRTLATGAAVAASVALVSLLVGIVFLSASRERERAARQQAVHNFQLARDAVDQYLTKVSEDERLQGKALEPLKRELLETARHFYDEFVKQAANDPGLRADLEFDRGRAYCRLAYLTGELGSKQKAIDLARTSMAIFASLHESFPTNEDYAFELADRYNDVGAFHHQMGQVDEAERHYLEAAKRFGALSKEHPERLEFANSLGQTRNNLGLLYEATLRTADARLAQESARNTFQRMSNKAPHNVRYRYHLASSLHNLARLHQVEGRVAMAESAFEESSQLLTTLIDMQQPEPDWIYLLGMNQNHRGWLYESSQRLDEAAEVLQDGLQRLERLVDTYPDVPKYQRVFATIRNQYGRVQLLQGDSDAAATSFQTALQLCQPLAEAEPGVAGNQDLLARIHYNLGWLSLEQEDLASSIAEYKKAEELEKAVVRDHPEVAEYQSILGWIHGDLAKAYKLAGEAALADAQYQASYEIWKNLVATGVPYYLSHAALALETWAAFLSTQDAFDEAEQKIREAVKLRRQVLEVRPSSQLDRRYLAGSLFQLALLQGRHDRIEQAISTYREILQLVPEYPEAHCNLGHKLRQLGRFSEAAASLRRGHELGSQFPAWNYPSQQWLEQCEQFAAVEQKLADVIAGRAEAEDGEQWVLLAEACTASQRPATAADMYRHAFAADNTLAGDVERAVRYTAATCAAQAFAGEGSEQLDESQRAELHQQAIEWLRADLAARQQQLQSGDPQDRDEVRRKLEYWKQDTQLDGIRGSELTPDQRERQKAFWSDVDGVLQRTRKKDVPGPEGLISAAGAAGP